MKKIFLLMVLSLNFSLLSAQSLAQGKKVDQGATQNKALQFQDVKTQQSKWSRDCTDEKHGCKMLYRAKLAEDTKQVILGISISRLKTSQMRIRFHARLGIRVDQPLRIKVDQGSEYSIRFLVCRATIGCVTDFTALPDVLANAMKKGRIMHLFFVFSPGTVLYRVSVPLIGFSAIYNTL